MYSADEYENLRDNGAADVQRGILIQLVVNEDGEYEADVKENRTTIIPMKCAFPIGKGTCTAYETLGKIFLDALDPEDGSQGYRLFHQHIHFDEANNFIEFIRVIILPVDIEYINRILPVDIEYINRSAEITFLVATGFELFLNTVIDSDAENLRLDGEEVSNPIGWFVAYLNNLRSLYPEYVWKRSEENGDDEDGSIEKIQKDAEQGDIEAQWKLGCFHDTGTHVSQDFEKAVYWYKKAAEQGHAEAAYNLAISYKDGEGIPQDFEKAVYWYKESAKLGDADAQNFLGGLYHSGNGVPKDPEKAVSLLEKSAEQGHLEAAYHLGVWYVSGDEVPQDFEKAEHWWHKAADGGLDLAQYNLGLMSERGDGVPQSFESAAHWYQEAAEQGYVNAQIKLGTFYADGHGVPQSTGKAAHWFQQAAEQGSVEAQDSLKRLQGDTCDKNIVDEYYEYSVSEDMRQDRLDAVDALHQFEATGAVIEVDYNKAPITPSDKIAWAIHSLRKQSLDTALGWLEQAFKFYFRIGGAESSYVKDGGPESFRDIDVKVWGCAAFVANYESYHDSKNDRPLASLCSKMGAQE
jgi:TPR repeat protein